MIMDLTILQGQTQTQELEITVIVKEMVSEISFANYHSGCTRTIRDKACGTLLIYVWGYFRSLLQ